MKTIIYAGIGLFSVAAAYGIADYYAEQKKGTFKTLYHDEPEVVVKKTEVKQASLIDNKTTVIEKNTLPPPVKKRENRKLELEDYSRAKLEEEIPVAIAEEPGSALIVASPKEDIAPPKEEQAAVEQKEPEAKFERKLEFRKFSRAPLRSSKKIASKKNSKQ